MGSLFDWWNCLIRDRRQALAKKTTLLDPSWLADPFRTVQALLPVKFLGASEFRYAVFPKDLRDRVPQRLKNAHPFLMPPGDAKLQRKNVKEGYQDLCRFMGMRHVNKIFFLSFLQYVRQ